MNIKKNIWNHHLEHANFWKFLVSRLEIRLFWQICGIFLVTVTSHLGQHFPPPRCISLPRLVQETVSMPNQTFGKKSVEHEWKSFVEDFPGHFEILKKSTWLLKWMPHYYACIIRCFFHPGGNFKRKFTTLLSWPEETHVSKLSRLVFFNLAASFLAARLTSSLATHSYL